MKKIILMWLFLVGLLAISVTALGGHQTGDFCITDNCCFDGLVCSEPSGWFIFGGQRTCQPPELPGCYDPDEDGFNSRATVTDGLGNAFTDTCIGKDSVAEFVCLSHGDSIGCNDFVGGIPVCTRITEDKVGLITYPCPNGFTCQDGACVNLYADTHWEQMEGQFDCVKKPGEAAWYKAGWFETYDECMSDLIPEYRSEAELNQLIYKDRIDSSNFFTVLKAGTDEIFKGAGQLIGGATSNLFGGFASAFDTIKVIFLFLVGLFLFYLLMRSGVLRSTTKIFK